MSYPVFFNNEVRPAMLVTGLNFAPLASVLAGAVVVAFCIGISFDISILAGGAVGFLVTALAICNPPVRGLEATFAAGFEPCLTADLSILPIVATSGLDMSVGLKPIELAILS
jgi:hypothetical protein